MLNSEAAKVASSRFLWHLGSLHLDELKGVFGNCIEPVLIWVVTFNYA
jgi:hypothetical protein